MKKALSLILCTVLLFCPLCVHASEVPETQAEAYVLYCPESGELLASHNADKRMKPASTTKLMTTLLTLEQAAKGNETVTFTQEMVSEGSSMYLKLGEKVTLRDLAVGMMMSSGNDAANAAAISIAGDDLRFARLMNERAEEIGRQLTAQKSAMVSFTEPSDKRVTYNNHNRLLSLYEYCIGGKTGYTSAAGRCLVSAAEKDGVTLICVTLDDKNDWNDHISLYEYGFSQRAAYQSPDSAFAAEVPVVGGEKSSVTVMGDRDFRLTVSAEDKDKIERKVLLDRFLYAPVREGQQVGRIEYTLRGERVGGTALKAAADVPEQKARGGLWEWIKGLLHHG